MAPRPIFLDYDQAALDREYNNRAKVSDHAHWLARYPRQSALARADLPARLDVAYGPHPGERLDLFLPPEPVRAPIHVFIHGGYWHLLDKSDFSFVALGLRPAGAVVAVINYALIPTVDMDELVRQCRTSIAWLHRHAASFGGDPHRISVSGHSAGGHLVAMLMATDWREFGAPADVVKAGCGFSGLYDLEPIRLSYLNEVLQLTSAVARRNSPVHLAPPPQAPLLLAVGGLEGPEYARQTDTLAAEWRTRGVPCDVARLANHHHFSIVAELENPKSELSRAILRQIGAGSRSS